ncbi:T9SS type A sorting domain-containing protein [Aequorivita sp. Q41]|uniref:T9SS type A sorting domain-containing protein n=1 Tax=Aequorivita sp. Q41 TaxID=3153300 RepID=UPI003241F781
MKKITLFIFLLISFTCISQNIIIDRTPPDPDNWVYSTQGTDGTGFYTADSFILDEVTAIGELDFYGGNGYVSNLGSLEVAFNVFIYVDDNGKPSGNPSQSGAGVVELSNIDPVHYSLIEYERGRHSDFSNIRITDANGGEQVVLPPGTYWVSAFPTVVGEPDGNGLWVWRPCREESTASPHPPHFIDPGNVLGGPWTVWTDIQSISGVLYESFSWTMREEQILGTENNSISKIVIYPNPSSDFINVIIPKTIEIFKTTLMDITGKQMNDIQLENGILDISLLSKGVYLLNIETSEGTLNKKIIKN